MELRDYFRIIRKRVWLIVLAGLLCPAAALVSSEATIPVYQATAKLLVVGKTDPGGGTASAYEGTLLSQQLVKSFAQILESRATAEAALRLDPQPFTPRQLQARVHAEPVTDTLLINLNVEDTNPARAKRLTNNIARAFIAAVPRLQSGSALRVSLVEPALTPTAPIRPRTRLNVALGLLLGLMLGVGLACLREFLDRSVKTPEELEVAVSAPVGGPRQVDGRRQPRHRPRPSRPTGRRRRRRPATAVAAQTLRPATAGRHDHGPPRPGRRPRRHAATRSWATGRAHLRPGPPEPVRAARVAPHGRAAHRAARHLRDRADRLRPTPAGHRPDGRLPLHRRDPADHAGREDHPRPGAGRTGRLRQGRRHDLRHGAERHRGHRGRPAGLLRLLRRVRTAARRRRDRCGPEPDRQQRRRSSPGRA